jgi:translation initiation factor 2 gamma subunit (eIF-2gamma)
MKSIFFACFLFVTSVTIAQDKTCTLWLGELSESTSHIKQFVEQKLELQTKILPAAANNIQEMKDDNDLVQIKIWLKPKKTLVNGAMATVYAISSFKIVTLSDKIDELYTELSGKVQACATETTPMNTVFGSNKMIIERHSGGFGKKGLPMSTLTITAK